jgi:hypothetical protein
MDDAEPAARSDHGPFGEDLPDSGVIRSAAGHHYAFWRVLGHVPPRWVVFPVPINAEVGWTTDTDPNGW